MIKELIPLSFKTTQNLEENLTNLLALIESCPDDSLIVAPEVCLSGFDYTGLEQITAFAPKALLSLEAALQNKSFIFTLLEKRGDEIHNSMKLFHFGRLLYERPKARLFRLGDEHKFMSQGEDEMVKIIDLGGIKVGVLVCFELRFMELWSRLRGCDVIAISAWWGAPRGEHLKKLSSALAVMNQCYVIVSDSANAECSGECCVISPFGESIEKGNTACLKVTYDIKKIVRMRRYIDVGIK